MPPIAGQLYDGICYESPSRKADHVSGLSQLVDLSEGLPKSVGTVLLDHRQRGSQGFDVLHMEHSASLPEIGDAAYTPQQTKPMSTKGEPRHGAG